MLGCVNLLMARLMVKNVRDMKQNDVSGKKGEKPGGITGIC